MRPVRGVTPEALLPSRRSKPVAFTAGVLALLWAAALPAAADPVSIIDRLHFALNEAEFGFADGGPAFVSPAAAVAGLDTPAIRRAYLMRELQRVEGDVTELSVRHLENPSDKRIERRLAAAERLAERLRADLGIRRDRARPAPLPRVPEKARVNMDGGAEHVLLRLRPTAATASSVAFRNIDRNGVRGRIVTGTQSLELQPTARLTSGIFARSRFGEAWTGGGTDRENSAGLGFGAASSYELDNGFILSTAILYGGSWNQSTVEGNDAQFGGGRLVADTRLDNRTWLGSWLLAPAVSLHYEQADRGSYADEDNVVAKARRRLGRVSATGELSRSFMNFTGRDVVTFHPFVRTGAKLELDDSGWEDPLEFATANGVIGGGLRVHFNDKASLLLSEEYARGEDDGTFRFAAEVGVPFTAGGNGQPPSMFTLSADADHRGDASASLNATFRFR